MRVINLEPTHEEIIRDFALRMISVAQEETAIVKGIHEGRKLRVTPASTIEWVIDQWFRQIPNGVLPYKFCPHCGEPFNDPR